MRYPDRSRPVSDRQALLAAICADPDDDTPRLVFADWLQDQGEVERAEFIRVQCEFTRLDQVAQTCPFIREYPNHMPVERWTEGVCQCRGCVLVRREHVLLRQNIRAWLAGTALGDPFDSLKGCGWQVAENRAAFVQFARGFVSEVTCSWADWQRHGPALAWHPREAEPEGCSACGGRGRTGYQIMPTDPTDDSARETAAAYNAAIPECPACDGKGRRPCPVTACPGVVVRLTDTPGFRLVEGAIGTAADWLAARLDGSTRTHRIPDDVATGTTRDYAAFLLGKEYPGVRRFVLPEPQWGTGGRAFVNGVEVRGIQAWEFQPTAGVPASDSR